VSAWQYQIAAEIIIIAWSAKCGAGSEPKLAKFCPGGEGSTNW